MLKTKCYNKENFNSLTLEDFRDTKPSKSSTSTTNSTSNFISKRSRIDGMSSKEQKMEINDEPEPPEDPNVPLAKVCLRLPTGSKETMLIASTNTIKVKTLKNWFITLLL